MRRVAVDVELLLLSIVNCNVGTLVLPSESSPPFAVQVVLLSLHQNELVLMVFFAPPSKVRFRKNPQKPLQQASPAVGEIELVLQRHGSTVSLSNRRRVSFVPPLQRPKPIKTLQSGSVRRLHLPRNRTGRQVMDVARSRRVMFAALLKVTPIEFFLHG